MDESTLEDYWAQLVSVTDIESSPVKITKNKLVIGRNDDCDLSFSGNRLVSGKHCYIEKSEGKVWICDTSTNGTLLNMTTKISKGNRHELQHGDEIHIIYKKNETEENVGYLFQERKQLEDEEMTQDYSTDQTLPDDDVNEVNESKSDASCEKPCLKRKQIQSEETQESDKKKKKDYEEKTEQAETAKSSDVDTMVKASTSKGGVGGGGDNDNDDDMLDTLTCIICQDILHDCISLQPCMHAFCAGCYSEWMEQSNQCPSCRMEVSRINKNHLVNNLVEAYLKARPDKKRPDEDIKGLDEKNKITRDMLYPKKQYTENSDDDCLDDDEDSDDDNDFGISIPPPPRIICRQCPDYDASRGLLPPTQDAPNDDEDAKTFPVVPDYTCPQNNSRHILCLCCLQPMPDRLREYITGGNFPPQQCQLCFRFFCHAYWGCLTDHCHGCIGKLKDLNFGKRCLTSIIMDNAYESNVIKEYMDRRNMSVKSLFADCLAKMVTGGYKSLMQKRLTNQGMNTPVCYACGFNIFKELAYSYRKEIPDVELPDEVVRRPNCHWGRNCRTQSHKPDHARRFNHICEQSRIV